MQIWKHKQKLYHGQRRYLVRILSLALTLPALYRYCIHSCVKVEGQRATCPLKSPPQGNKLIGIGNGSYSVYTEEVLPGFPTSEPITHIAH